MNAPSTDTPDAAALYAFGEFRLDVAARTLWRNGVEAVQLPSRAFDSLVYLIENRDRLVQKNELIDAVWHDVVVSDDSLSHAISVLRRALADDPNHAHYVQTVPRRGYRFVAPVSVISAPPPAAAPRGPWLARRHAVLGAATAAALVGAAIAIAAFTQRTAVEPQSAPPTPQRAVRLFQPPPEGAAITSGGTLSPNGELLTFVARDNSTGRTALWVRTLHSAGLERLEHTEGATKPFWSPDSRRLAFFANGKLMTVDVRDGALREVTPIGVSAAGGTWAPDDTILFADWATGLYTVRAAGAEPELVVALDRDARDIAFSSPQFLPDGRRFLYQIVSLDAARTGAYVGDLDTRRSVRLLDTESPAVFAPPGHLLHVQHDLLLAEEFDASTATLTGRATILARGVLPPSLSDDNAVSAGGELIAYRRGVRHQQLAWVDRAGAVLGTLSMPVVVFNPRMSPDGAHLLATSSVTTNPGLWLASLTSPAFERIETDAIAPLWSADGRQIAFTARGGFDVLIRPMAGSGSGSRRIASGSSVKILNDWAPSGEHIVFTQRGEQTNLDLWGINVDSGETFPILATPNNELQARLSPDGRWLAYAADDTGLLEVYVARYPALDERHRISSGGGGQPQWRRDQSELYYITPDRTLVVLDVSLDSPQPFGSPRHLFRAPVAGDPDGARDYYAATADGDRFLLDGSFGYSDDTPITVVVNWPAETQSAATAGAQPGVNGLGSEPHRP